jgi:hypothetical protein
MRTQENEFLPTFFFPALETLVGVSRHIHQAKKKSMTAKSTQRPGRLGLVGKKVIFRRRDVSA